MHLKLWSRSPIKDSALSFAAKAFLISVTQETENRMLVSARAMEKADRSAILAIRRTVFADHCSDAEMAAALGISLRTLHRFVVSGLPAKKVGRTRWFDPDAVARWFAARPVNRNAA